jgi:hypothetical protein
MSDVEIERTLGDSDDDQGEGDNEDLHEGHAFLIGVTVTRVNEPNDVILYLKCAPGGLACSELHDEPNHQRQEENNASDASDLCN